MDEYDPLSDFIRSGWMRHLPYTAVDIFGAVVLLAREGPVRFDDALSRHHDDRPGDPAWGPPDETDSIDPEENALRAEREAEVARTAAHVGMLPPKTRADVAELMITLGLIERDPTGHCKAVAVLPLPDERIPLIEEERAHEDAIRWHDLHASTSYRVIDLFVDEDRHSLSTSLRKLARTVERDPESVRQAILLLLEDGDFSADHHPEQLGLDVRFTLSVDWEFFHDNRIGIRPAPPAEADRDSMSP